MAQSIGVSGVSNITLADLLALSEHTLESSQHLIRHHGWYSGAWLTRVRGPGADYDDLRPYCAGDDIRHIDWRASARTACLQTRLFRAETEHRMVLVTDLRDCMFTGSSRLRSVTAARLSAKVVWQACDAGTRITQICLNEKGLYISESTAGKNAGVNACRVLADAFQQQRQLSAVADETSPTTIKPARTTTPVQPQIKAGSGNADLTMVLKHLIKQRRQGAGIIWITGMDSPGDDFFHLLRTRDRRDLHTFVEVYDPLLYNGLPVGQYVYQSRSDRHSSTRTLRVNDVMSKRLSSALQAEREQLRQKFLKLGIAWLSGLEDDAWLIPGLQRLGLLP